MGKSAHDDVLDAIGNYFKTNGKKMTACEGEPTTYEHANSTKGTGTGKALADITLDSDDYTLANDTSGRKATIGEQADVTIDASGDADHVAIVDTTNEKLLYVTTCTSQTLTAANTVTFPAWKINIEDPA